MATAVRTFLQQIDRGAWIRFFAALGGLTISLAAAMFSTVLRQNGDGTGAAIAASFALLSAGAVGLYTVPYLAKRVAFETLRETFDYDVTREGLVYMAVALVIGVAALNTGNNLLFIVVAAMLAGVLVSGVASALVLGGLRLDVTLPNHVFARQEVMARIHLRNGFKVPSFSVSVVPPKPKSAKRFYWEKGMFIFPPKAPKQRQWIRLPDLKLRYVDLPRAADAIFQGAVYFPYISGGESAFADILLNFPRRGRYVQESFGVSTRFPFSFLRKTRRVPSQREILVYPSVEATDEFFQVLPMITGEFEAFVRGRGYDLYLIREHVPGDSARHVDWKASAKAGGLKVREFTREDERKLRIVFDNPGPGQVSDSAYESAVQLAASIAWHFAGTNTELSFVSQGFEAAHDVFTFLRFLAMVQPAAGNSVLPELKATRDYNLVLTAQPRGTLPTALWASSYIVFLEKSSQ